MDNESQLDISAPLLSARKHLHPRGIAPGTEWIVTGKSPRGGQFALLVDSSEWEFQDVKKPAAVPFQWEKTPGTAKRDFLYHSDKDPAITPRPPPGRLFEPSTPRPHQTLSGEVCRSSRLLLPGRLFGVKRIAGDRTPLLSPGKLESLKQSMNAESGDEVFSDALDTFSSLNSSVSRLSSSYHRNCGSAGNFSVDPQTRDFMMSRFLPAAEAAAVHTPRVFPVKPTVAIPSEKISLVKIEDEDVEYDDNKVGIGMTCGVFQRLCVKHTSSRSDSKSGRKIKNKLSKYSGPVDKYAYAVNCKKVYPAQVTSQELPKDESKKIYFLSNSNKMTDRQSPIMEKCNRGDNFLGREELESGKVESNCALLLPPIPIPLPKSPSESWLCHARPSVPLRNLFSDSQPGGYLQYASKNNSPSTGPKWEKFVQSSIMHQDNLSNSEEMPIQGPPSKHDGQ